MGGSEAPSSDGLQKLVQAALQKPVVHPRVQQQGFWSDEARRRQLLENLLPPMKAFPGRDYFGAQIVLDWDHRLPSRNLLLRIFASYTPASAQRLEQELKIVQERIAADDIYPEFDLPDFASIQADELYVAEVVVQRGEEPEDRHGLALDAVRFYSDWRRDVDPEILTRVRQAVARDDTFVRAKKQQISPQFSETIVVGWTPPCAAKSRHWALELWLVTNFEGRFGKARVFMVDSEDGTVSRSFETDIQLAA